MPRADFLFSLLLIALGLAAAVEAWRMPRFENLGVHPMTAPGLTPGLLGIVVAILGAVLMAGAIRGGGWRRRWMIGAVRCQHRKSTYVADFCIQNPGCCWGRIQRKRWRAIMRPGPS